VLEKLKNFIWDVLFPKYCFSCHRQGSFLCQDCKSTLEIIDKHQKLNTVKYRYLDDLYFPLEYKGYLIKNLIQKFKYEPFVKELSKTLSDLIIEHFQLIEEKPDFSNFLVLPIPLEKKKLKWRGFNQSSEIGKNIAQYFKVDFLDNILMKNKKTLPQVALPEAERRKNVLGVFSVKLPEKIQGRKILLIDDVYTTGTTMEEAAKVLKTAGAKEIIGVVVAKAGVKDDINIIDF